MEKISSKDNKQVKFAMKLISSSAFRKKNGLFVLEGARLCADAAVSGVEIDEVFVTQECIEKYSDLISPCINKSSKIWLITNDVSQKMADTANPQGIYCVCKMLDKSVFWNKIDSSGAYLMMENVQDPSNLGAICRTAEALGINGIIACGGCDMYNLKALRASMGSLMRMPPIVAEDIFEIINYLKNELNMKVYACVPNSNAAKINDINLSGGVVCVIGNEGNGLKEKTIENSTLPITIPMLGRAESLNASMAAGIVMWEMIEARRD